jgi:hypothetical protein
MVIRPGDSFDGVIFCREDGGDKGRCRMGGEGEEEEEEEEDNGWVVAEEAVSNKAGRGMDETKK